MRFNTQRKPAGHVENKRLVCFVSERGSLFVSYETCVVLKKVDTFCVVILVRVYTSVFSPETGFQ